MWCNIFSQLSVIFWLVCHTGYWAGPQPLSDTFVFLKLHFVCRQLDSLLYRRHTAALSKNICFILKHTRPKKKWLRRIQMWDITLYNRNFSTTESAFGVRASTLTEQRRCEMTSRLFCRKNDPQVLLITVQVWPAARDRPCFVWCCCCQWWFSPVSEYLRDAFNKNQLISKTWGHIILLSLMFTAGLTTWGQSNVS